MEHFVGRADELAVLDAAMAAVRAGLPRVVLVEGAPGPASQVSPVLVFAIMFGLSMDYEVFLVSRIRERYDATGGHRAAIASGLQRTGGVITSAALLLIIVVGAFSAPSITIIKLIGVSMIVALVLDATLVRMLLVPATMRLLGTASWWAPRRAPALRPVQDPRGRRPGPEIAKEPVTQPGRDLSRPAGDPRLRPGCPAGWMPAPFRDHLSGALVRPVSHVVLGAGPVGRAVVTALAARGIETAVVTRSGTAVAGAVSRAADLADPAQAAAAVAGADVVFQCASPAYHRWPEQFPALQAAAVTAAAAAGTLLVAAENLYGYGGAAGPLTEDLPLAATIRKGAVRAQLWRDLLAAHQAGRMPSWPAGRRIVRPRRGCRLRRRRPLLPGPGPGPSRRRPGRPGPPAHLYLRRRLRQGPGPAVVRAPDLGRAWHVPSAPAVSGLMYVLAAAVTTAGAVALRAAGVPLAVHGKIPLAGFAQITFIAAVIGGVLLVLLNRAQLHPRSAFKRSNQHAAAPRRSPADPIGTSVPNSPATI